MMRKCHLNTCPVGVATQDPELRKLFTGNPDHVVNYFTFVAEDLRSIMAELGFRTVDEMVGRTDLLEVKYNEPNWKTKNLDLSPLLYRPNVAAGVGSYKQKEQDHEIHDIIDRKLMEIAKPAIESGKVVKQEFKIINTDRSVGAMLSNEICKVHGGVGLPAGTIDIKFVGSAGQSFGAFTTTGVRFTVEGEANDYFGKGLSGAELVIYPNKKSKYVAEDNMIIGNVAFYGATSGKAFIRGQAGERFCVRNSGVTTVVEGIGDHGVEYMTGGRVVVLGKTGRNFGAGMSGGYAYIWDKWKEFAGNFNNELADIEAISADDAAELKALIEEHFQYTDSGVAKSILENWDKELKYFKKVMPRDYKRVMEKKKAEKKEKKELVK